MSLLCQHTSHENNTTVNNLIFTELFDTHLLQSY